MATLEQVLSQIAVVQIRPRWVVAVVPVTAVWCGPLFLMAIGRLADSRGVGPWVLVVVKVGFSAIPEFLYGFLDHSPELLWYIM